MDGHGQQHSNEDLEELAKELSQQREEEKEKDKDPPLKCTKTSDLQRILSATYTLTDELCDTDHDWERSAKVKRSKMVSIGPCSEIPKERKKEVISAVNIAGCLQKKGRSSTRDFITEV